MEHNFWHDKWEKNQIGFHQKDINPFLIEFLPTLIQAEAINSPTVFVPLCGKTLDIGWILSKGYEVVACELVESAVIELFSSLDVNPEIIQLDNHKKYSVQSLTVYVGDIFQLDAELLGPVDFTYDRAAFVAMPESMRDDYVVQVVKLTKAAPQLLITYDYDQELIQGPPFSHSKNSIHDSYQEYFALDLLTEVDADGGVRGVPAKEHIWYLKPNT
ncbi:thiopurine S-methyltransferase [Glaciecola sp. 1036]|uniref:thiopurine S-methyltransferase n=1 Tax=Alteromonadaceae TaxID=72275 RepID=UPI003D05A576